MPPFLTLAVLLVAAQPTAPVDYATAFRRGASSGELRALVPIVENEDLLFSPKFRGVRELLERYDCISIESVRTDAAADGDAIVLEVDGSAVTRNAKHERVAIPPRWYVTLSPGGSKVTAIEDEASRAALRLLEARSDDEREAVLANAHAPLPHIARIVADEVADGEWPHAGAAAESLLLQSDAETESYALAALARLDYKTGSEEAAVRLAHAARDAAALSGSCDAIAHADYVAGFVETDRGRILEFLRAAWAARDALDDRRIAHRALYRQFRHHLQDYDVPACRAVLEALEASGRRFGDRNAVTSARHGMAILTAMLEDTEGAFAMARRIAQSARVLMVDPEVQATVLAMVGRITPEHEDALAVVARAETIVPAGATALRVYMGSERLERLGFLRRYDEAAAVLEQMLEMAGNPEARVYLRNVLVSGVRLRYEQGLYAQAMELARRGIAIDPDGLWLAWALRWNLAWLQIACADDDGAIATLSEAIEGVETRRALTTASPILRARHFATRADIYRMLIEALVRQHRFEEALHTAEQLKARSLAESMAGIGTQLPMSAAESDTERALEAALVARNRELLAAQGRRKADARKQVIDARAKLEAFHKDLAFRHATGAAAASSDVLDLVLTTRTPIVEYAVGSESVIAFVIRDGRVEARTLPASPATIEAEARRFLRKLERRSLDYAATARVLYDQLVAPVADLLPRRGPVTIVPDLFLWQVPFNVLLDARRQFFGDLHAVSYSPALSLLGIERRAGHSRRKKTLLAVGDSLLTAEPRPDRDDHPPLPDTAREVHALKMLYTPAQSTVLTGATARESLFKKIAGRYRIIHLATHGLVDDSSPLYSALLVGAARGDGEDGLLEMREIGRLQLDADLVVLSGCDTARGAIYNGEGVVGLSWAFLVAGCPRTVVSRWTVDSKATADLMILFHERLRAGDSAAEALRKAQLELRRKPRYRQPFYWAPFVVVASQPPI